MKDTTLTIRDLETLQILSDPIRFRVFQTVNYLNSADEPCTVKKLAREIGMPPGKLYYHVNLLVEHNLLLVSETRLVSGIVEKFYRAVASAIVVDRDLFATHAGATAEARETLTRMAAGVFKSVIADLENMNGVLEAQNPPHIIGKESLYLTKAQAHRVHEAIYQLMQEIKSQDNTQNEERAPYTFAFAFYPNISIESSTKEIL